jgi:hypothetical protein
MRMVSLKVQQEYSLGTQYDNVVYLFSLTFLIFLCKAGDTHSQSNFSLFKILKLSMFRGWSISNIQS